MATIATYKSDSKFVGLPKNKTGLFAADTIHEVKPTRNNLINVPALSPQFRHNGTTSVLLATSEQNHHQLQQYRLSTNEIQQYYPLDGNNATYVDCSNDSRLTLSGIRNGFRPSTVRHQPLRLSTMVAHRNHLNSVNKDVPSRLTTTQSQIPTRMKSAFIQSHASARLKSEIDHLQSKLRRHGESSKSFRTSNGRDIDGTPHSDYSYSTSCRLSSASTAITADRLHQRFSSALTPVLANTSALIAAINDTSKDSIHIIPGNTPISQARAALEKTDQQQDLTDQHVTHAYQIPQQSNVGSESFLPSNVPMFSAVRVRSVGNERRHNEPKSIACPFYVMYLTNLTMQQRSQKDDTTNNNGENAETMFHIGTTTVSRKVPVNSRTSTAQQRNHIFRRQVNSPISINTCSTVDTEETMTNSAGFAYNKRLSARTLIHDNEDSPLLQGLLRTTSWHHVQT